MVGVQPDITAHIGHARGTADIDIGISASGQAAVSRHVRRVGNGCARAEPRVHVDPEAHLCALVRCERADGGGKIQSGETDARRRAVNRARTIIVGGIRRHGVGHHHVGGVDRAGVGDLDDIFQLPERGGDAAAHDEHFLGNRQIGFGTDLDHGFLVAVLIVAVGIGELIGRFVAKDLSLVGDRGPVNQAVVHRRLEYDDRGAARAHFSHAALRDRRRRHEVGRIHRNVQDIGSRIGNGNTIQRRRVVHERDLRRQGVRENDAGGGDVAVIDNGDRIRQRTGGAQGAGDHRAGLRAHGLLRVDNDAGADHTLGGIIGDRRVRIVADPGGEDTAATALPCQAGLIGQNGAGEHLIDGDVKSDGGADAAAGRHQTVGSRRAVLDVQPLFQG